MSAKRMGPPAVAILNSSDDTVEMLRMMLETAGMLAISAHLDDIKRGTFDFGGFLKEHDPRVIVFDVAPPYDRNWLLFEHLRSLETSQGRQWVLTSTNPARVQQFGKPEQEIFEVVGKPYDMQLIVDAVKKALD